MSKKTKTAALEAAPPTVTAKPAKERRYRLTGALRQHLINEVLPPQMAKLVPTPKELDGITNDFNKAVHAAVSALFTPQEVEIIARVNGVERLNTTVEVNERGTYGYKSYKDLKKGESEAKTTVNRIRGIQGNNGVSFNLGDDQPPIIGTIKSPVYELSNYRDAKIVNSLPKTRLDAYHKHRQEAFDLIIKWQKARIEYFNQHEAIASDVRAMLLGVQYVDELQPIWPEGHKACIDKLANSQTFEGGALVPVEVYERLAKLFGGK